MMPPPACSCTGTKLSLNDKFGLVMSCETSYMSRVIVAKVIKF